MTRKECYEYIKTHNLQYELKQNGYSNFTNMTTIELVNFVNNHKNKTIKKQINKTQKCVEKSCVDKGARRAIIAIATYLKLKNIEKNF